MKDIVSRNNSVLHQSSATQEYSTGKHWPCHPQLLCFVATLTKVPWFHSTSGTVSWNDQATEQVGCISLWIVTLVDRRSGLSVGHVKQKPSIFTTERPSVSSSISRGSEQQLNTRPYSPNWVFYHDETVISFARTFLQKFLLFPESA